MLKKLILAALLAAAAPAGAEGLFDDMSDADRGRLRAEIKQYLLDEPELLLEVIALIEERREASEAADDAARLTAAEGALYGDPLSHVAGNPDGDVTIVEFFDYQCGYCKKAHPEVSELLKADGNIRLVKKEFPILGPMSEVASRAAVAVLLEDGGAVYKDFSDLLMAHTGPLNEVVIERLAKQAGADVERMKSRAGDDDVSGVIADNRKLATDLRLSGTPSFIFGDQVIRGYVPLTVMEGLVTDMRNDM